MLDNTLGTLESLSTIFRNFGLILGGIWGLLLAARWDLYLEILGL